MWDFIQKGEEEFFKLFSKFKKRDFSGNEGQAIENSGYQLAITLIAKFGSLIFTIVMARMLMPELFGLYSLALGTIVLFTGFSDFGIGAALVTFVSKSLGKKNPQKAKAYFSKLIKLKFIIVLFATIVLLSLAYFVAKFYYHKPIFYALLVGGLYLPLSSFLGFFEGIFRATNRFKYILIKEILYQFLRFGLIPISIFFLLKTNISQESLIASIILILSLCFSTSLLFLLIFSRKKVNFIKLKKQSLSPKDKSGLRKFILPLILTVLSGAFFGYIDMVMLGHFVTSEFVGYYSAAFSLIASAATILSFSFGALLPIFSRLRKKQVNLGFKRVLIINFVFSFIAALVTFFLAKYVVLVAYGISYLPSISLLKAFAIFLLFGSTISIYEMYFTSQEKTKVLAILVVISTLINISLNFVFINYGLRFGMFEAIFGACIATLISRALYLIGLIILKKIIKT